MKKAKTDGAGAGGVGAKQNGRANGATAKTAKAGECANTSQSGRGRQRAGADAVKRRVSWGRTREPKEADEEQRTTRTKTALPSRERGRRRNRQQPAP